MAAQGIAPRTGAWSGIFVGMDLIARELTLALDRKGNRLSGELTITVNASTGQRAAIRVTGSSSAGKVTLSAPLPRSAKGPKVAIRISGRVVASTRGRQAIIATAAPATTTKLTEAGGIPLYGSLTLTSGPTTIRVADGEGGGWVDEGPQQ